MKTVDILLQTADLLEEPGRWTQGAYARNVDGEATFFDSDNAVCYCVMGALGKIAGPGNHNTATRLICEEAGIYSLTSFNDAPGRTQQEVVDMLRRAAMKEMINA